MILKYKGNQWNLFESLKKSYMNNKAWVSIFLLYTGVWILLIKLKTRQLTYIKKEVKLIFN